MCRPPRPSSKGPAKHCRHRTGETDRDSDRPSGSRRHTQPFQPDHDVCISARACTLSCDLECVGLVCVCARARARVCVRACVCVVCVRARVNSRQAITRCTPSRLKHPEYPTVRYGLPRSRFIAGAADPPDSPQPSPPPPRPNRATPPVVIAKAARVGLEAESGLTS